MSARRVLANVLGGSSKDLGTSLDHGGCPFKENLVTKSMKGIRVRLPLHGQDSRSFRNEVAPVDIVFL